MAKKHQNWWAKTWQHTWVKWVAGVIGVIAGLFALIGALNAFVFTPVKDPVYGVSFSQKRSQELGLDWRANYLALLNDLDFKHFRLMSYWDVHEERRGKLDFSTLDWQMDQAAKHGAKVSLAIGLRQPRWPECHLPGWAATLGGHEYKQALYAYMEVVVKRYKNHPALASWQLENEGMNNWFGTCDLPDRERLIEEYDLVKKWAPDIKIIMSLSDQHGLPLGKPVPDEYGFSIYRTVWNNKIQPHGYLTYPTPIWYHRARAAVIGMIQHRPVMIHELQVEPWGQVDTMLLSNEEQDKSMSIEQIGKVVQFARQTDIKEMYMWGGEWWYWRKAAGDPRIWEAVRYQLETAR